MQYHKCCFVLRESCSCDSWGGYACRVSFFDEQLRSTVWGGALRVCTVVLFIMHSVFIKEDCYWNKMIIKWQIIYKWHCLTFQSLVGHSYICPFTMKHLLMFCANSDQHTLPFERLFVYASWWFIDSQQINYDTYFLSGAVNMNKNEFLLPHKDTGLPCRGTVFHCDMVGRMHPDKLVWILAFPQTGRSFEFLKCEAIWCVTALVSLLLKLFWGKQNAFASNFSKLYLFQKVTLHVSLSN